MGRRYQDSKTPREVRRQTEQMIHAVLRGSDTWGLGLLEWVCIIAFIAIVVLADRSAHGDLIVEVDYLDTTVYHESEALVDEIGLGLSGKGRSLGWLAFYQPETFWGVGPAVEFGSWSERYGGTTQQALQFYADADGYLRTGLYGERITGDVGALVAGGYLRPDTQVPIGHTAVYLPFVWSSHADQFGGDEPDTLFSGTGWISLTAFSQTPPAGTPASFTVGEVLLVNADSYAGQTTFAQAVPEPATWGLFALVCCVLVIYKRGAAVMAKRKTRWHYWPISFGWVRRSCHAIICWHGWPVAKSSMNSDATYKDCGWTLHIGALKIYFGKKNDAKRKTE